MRRSWDFSRGKPLVPRGLTVDGKQDYTRVPNPHGVQFTGAERHPSG
jgi:hypothetical protein